MPWRDLYERQVRLLMRERRARLVDNLISVWTR